MSYHWDDDEIDLRGAWDEAEPDEEEEDDEPEYDEPQSLFLDLGRL